MADPATLNRLSAIRQIETDLQLEVELAGAEYHNSLNGNHEAAKLRYIDALLIFNNFLLNHRLPSKGMPWQPE